MADRTIYVGNVGATVDEFMLRSIFENCGFVKQVRMAGCAPPNAWPVCKGLVTPRILVHLSVRSILERPYNIFCLYGLDARPPALVTQALT